jgi:hypothetical protein
MRIRSLLRSLGKEERYCVLVLGAAPVSVCSCCGIQRLQPQDNDKQCLVACPFRTHGSTLAAHYAASWRRAGAAGRHMLAPTDNVELKGNVTGGISLRTMFVEMGGPGQLLFLI